MTIYHLYPGEPLPALDGFDMLTVMGGPMSANDEAQYAWLGPEIALVRDAIGPARRAGRVPRAQIVAKALGARVYAAKQKEIGWFEVERTEAAHPIFDGLPAAFTVFHWHGETFDLPAGAVRQRKQPRRQIKPSPSAAAFLACNSIWRRRPRASRGSSKMPRPKSGPAPSSKARTQSSPGIGACAVLEPLLGRVLGNLTRAPGEGK